MSHRLAQLVRYVNDPQLQGWPKAILFALAWHCNEQAQRAECFPSVGMLAQWWGIDRRTVQRALRQLEDGGWIRRTGKGVSDQSGRTRRAARYRLNMKRIHALRSRPASEARIPPPAEPDDGAPEW